jgi:cytochrome oxidase assembly protein ShyY1
MKNLVFIICVLFASLLCIKLSMWQQNRYDYKLSKIEKASMTFNGEFVLDPMYLYNVLKSPNGSLLYSYKLILPFKVINTIYLVDLGHSNKPYELSKIQNIKSIIGTLKNYESNNYFANKNDYNARILYNLSYEDLYTYYKNIDPKEYIYAYDINMDDIKNNIPIVINKDHHLMYKYMWLFFAATFLIYLLIYIKKSFKIT